MKANVLSIIRNRFASLMGMSHGGQRDLYEVFGYPREISADMLYAMYLRGGIANRIIRAYPQATWRDEPVVRDEDGDSSERLDAKGNENTSYSPFVEAVENFFEEHKLWSTIERADRLAGIGRFGIILLGFKDGQDLSKPLTKRKAPLLYASAYGEPNVMVSTWETNPQSPRYGLPVEYQIRQDFSAIGSTAPTRTLLKVHWSRVLHVAEFLDSDDSYGVPRLMPVYNHIMDLEKVVGGSAETFWLSANRGLALWADKEAALSEEDIDNIKGQADEFQHQLRRYLVGSGMTAQLLGADSPDAGPIADRLVDLIAGSIGIPKRVLLGTERGELASSQDENNWSSRVDERRRNYATPRILRPLVQRLVDTGNLPKPKGQWWIEWPDIASLDPVQRSQVAVNRANAISTYARSPGAELIVPPQEFRRDILEMPPESEYEIPEETLLEEDPLEEGDPDDNLDTNALPRTLYVHRKVLNANVIKRWAKAQGFVDILPDLHVTIARSQKPVDWMKASNPYGQDDEGNLTIEPGGVRLIDPLGNGEVAALLFTDDRLLWRHRGIHADTGAEWIWPDYQPHISITRTMPDFDLKKVKPYTGAIVLGPEIWEEVKEDVS